MLKKFLFAVLLCISSAGPVLGETEVKALPDLDSLIEPIRVKHDLPGLAAAVFSSDGKVLIGATGFRKKGEKEPVTPQDHWHLGSDTKSMTSMLIGTFVAEKVLSWDDKVSKFFPKLAKSMDPAFENTTIADLLAHRSGLTANLNWRKFDDRDIRQQREKATRELLTTPPEFKAGEYHYSNAGYILAGAILEQLTKTSWEKLITERLFKPLNMKTAGFGGVGTPGKIDQPWGHLANGQPVDGNGPLMDNALNLGPAGTVHASLEDWSKYLIDQLRGGAEKKAFFPADIYKKVQTGFPKGTRYGFGWGVIGDGRAKGKVLTHDGSNTMNYASAWLAIDEGFGIAVCTNSARDSASEVCDEVIGALIEWRKKNEVAR